MARTIDSYNRPYPSRDDPDIQTIIYSKKEFRECAPAVKQNEEVRVDPLFYNNQVFLQRTLYVWRSIFCIWDTGAGKTGMYECFRQNMVQNYPGEISTFFYVAPETQQGDFQYQISMDFSTEDVKELFNAIKGDNYKAVTSNQTTILRKVIKEAGYITLTYDEISKQIDAMDNNEVVKTFNNAALMIDEIQFIKLDESKDNVLPKDQRDRLRLYKSYWRVSKLCPNCVFILATGTPMTNSTNELIYHVNLMPNTKQIRTSLSVSIAKDMEEKYGIVIKEDDWIDIDIYSRRQLEIVLRGRVSYIRAPLTGGVETYPVPTEEEIWKNVEYDDQLHKTVVELTMSQFQARAYLESMKKLPNPAKVKIKEGDKLYLQSLQACVFAFPTKAYANWRLGKGKKPSAIRESAIGTEGLNNVSKKGKIEYAREYAATRYAAGLAKKGKLTNKVILVKTRIPKEWFLDFIAKDENLIECGVKVFDVVKNAMNPDLGQQYVASMFKNSTCGIIGWALKVRGFEEFDPRRGAFLDTSDISKRKFGKIKIGKAQRFAIITSSNKKYHQQILKLAHHPDNLRGEYLKLIMVTKVGTVGLNMKEKEVVGLLEPGYTPAQWYQTKNRAFRPTSYIGSLRWAKKHRPEHPDIFPVYVSNYIAELPQMNHHNKQNRGNSSSSSSSQEEISTKTKSKIVAVKTTKTAPIWPSHLASKKISNWRISDDDSSSSDIDTPIKTQIKSVANGKWQMANGKWQMANGKAISKPYRSHIEAISKHSQSISSTSEKTKSNWRISGNSSSSEADIDIKAPTKSTTKKIANWRISGNSSSSEADIDIKAPTKSTTKKIANWRISNSDSNEDTSIKISNKLVPAKKLPVKKILAKVSNSETEESIDSEEGEELNETIDWQLYLNMYQKDKDIAIVMRHLKEISIDAEINRPRNVRATDKSKSFECDYQRCGYRAFNCDTTVPLDLSTYDSYYVNKSINKVIKSLAEFFTKINAAKISTIADALPFSSIEIISGLRYLVENKVSLRTDYLGFKFYLSESAGVFYTTREPNAVAERSLSYYAACTTFTYTQKLEDIMIDYIGFEQLGKYIRTIEKSKHYLDYCAGIATPYKVKLFEEAILLNIVGDPNSKNEKKWIWRIIDAMTNLYLIITEGDAVTVIHHIESLYSRGTNYNAVDSVLKPAKKLRLLDPVTGGWRNCNQAEIDIYAQMPSDNLKTTLEIYYERLKNLGFMGIIVRPDMVHIRNIVVKDTDELEGKGGTQCVGIRKTHLIDMLYDCSQKDSSKKVYNKTEKNRIIGKIVKRIPKISREYLGIMSDKKLAFYLEESKLINKAVDVSLERRLCDCLAKKNAIFAVVGEIETTVNRIK
jgi:hypothetical protein